MHEHDDGAGAFAPVEVRIVHPIDVAQDPADQITTAQTALALGAQDRIASALPTRTRLVIVPRGGDVVIGRQELTAGTGFLVPDGGSLTLMGTAAVYALATALTGAATAVTVHIYAEHRSKA